MNLQFTPVFDAARHQVPPLFHPVPGRQSWMRNDAAERLIGGANEPSWKATSERQSYGVRPHSGWASRREKWLVIKRFDDGRAADVDHSDNDEEAMPVLVSNPPSPAYSCDSSTMNPSG